MSLLDNIVSYYKFDVNSSTQVDSAGSKNATVTNAVYDASGKINGAYDFNGSDTVISAPNIVGYGTDDFSISAWFKTTGNSVEGMCGYGDRFDSTGWAAVIFNGVARFIIDDGTTQVICDGGSGLKNGLWHHYVATVDKSGDLTLYVDGTDVASCSISTLGSMTTASHDVVDIGAYWYDGELFSSGFFDGNIDELGIWVGKVLSQSEVTELYNSGDGLQYPFGVLTGPPVGSLNLLGVGR